MHSGKPVVITDLDGTLLDSGTYGYGAAIPAIERLERNAIPLVLCSSKTAAEMRVIRKRLDNRYPFIIENGGGIYLPVCTNRDERSLDKITLGTPRSQILPVLESLRDRQRYKFTGFADMTAAELALYTGLDAQQAELALMREYTEPLMWLGDADAWQSFYHEILRRGLTCIRGGRFFHIQGNCDKGAALHRLRSYYRLQFDADPTFIALGDSENDTRMLEAADIAFIISNDDNADLQVSNPRCFRSKETGPAGWNSCVNEYLDGIK